MASLVHLAFKSHSLSITFAPSQSMMQLFLSAWSVNADLCSITVDTLFSSLVNCLVVMFSTSLCSSSLVPNVLPVSPIYTYGYNSYKGSGIHSLSFYYLPLCPLDALVFIWCLMRSNRYNDLMVF